MSIGVVNKSEFDAEMNSLGVIRPKPLDTPISIEAPLPEVLPEVIPETETELESKEISLEDTFLFEDENETVEVRTIQRGRGIGNTGVPEELRNLIGVSSVSDGRRATLELTKALGISPSSQSAYAVGATSTASYNEPSKSLLEHINARKEKISKRASKVLTNALREITPEALADVKVKDLATIASSMSVIIRNMEPERDKTPIQAQNANQFVIFAPQIQTEEKFETIKVNEI